MLAFIRLNTLVVLRYKRRKNYMYRNMEKGAKIRGLNEGRVTEKGGNFEELG